VSAVPTILRIDGLRVVIYPNDHPPAHVHLLGPWVGGGDQLIGLKVRETIACDEREARRVLRLVAGHQGTLMGAWRRFHG
jgi:Domain of unknown function (DUF4160)